MAEISRDLQSANLGLLEDEFRRLLKDKEYSLFIYYNCTIALEMVTKF